MNGLGPRDHLVERTDVFGEGGGLIALSNLVHFAPVAVHDSARFPSSGTFLVDEGLLILTRFGNKDLLFRTTGDDKEEARDKRKKEKRL